MDPVRTRKASRVIFYLAAIAACAGLGLAVMGYVAVGVVALVAGLAVMIVCQTVLKFFSQYDMAHMMSSRKPKRQRGRCGRRPAESKAFR